MNKTFNLLIEIGGFRLFTYMRQRGTIKFQEEIYVE